MTSVELTCGECAKLIEVTLEATVMHVEAEIDTVAELLFQCPECNACDISIVQDGLELLIAAGAFPLTLNEPQMDECDKAPPGPRFDWDDLLDWHEGLRNVVSVAPWE